MDEERLEEGPLSLRRLFADVDDPQKESEELLGIVGHDLRSPLANIRSYTSMILSKRGPPLEPRVERAAKVIVKNADRGLRQIEDLLDLIRAQSHDLDFEREELPLSELIQGGIQRAEVLAAERKVQLHREANGDNPPLSGDGEKLERALAALIEAGIRRTPEGGTVRIGVERGASSIRILVEDEGGALSEEDREAAFDWLRQVLANNRLVAGISLALSRIFVRAHGGEVGVESAGGRGARWFASLPRTGSSST